MSVFNQVVVAVLLSASLTAVILADSQDSDKSESRAAISALKHNKKPLSNCVNASQGRRLNCASSPSSVFDKQGRLWVVWTFSGHVYVSYSDDKANTFSSPVAVNRIPEAVSSRGENRPKIALDKAGNIFVSWTTPLEKRFTGHIRFSYSVNGGKDFSDPVIVNDNRDITGHRFDALGVNDKGNIYIAWLDKRDRLRHEKRGEKYHGAAVYFTWSDDGGKSFKSDQKIMDHSCECCRMAIDFDERDLPVILWRNIFGNNIRDHALVRFTSSGTPEKAERVSFDDWQIDACPHHGPDMSINQKGEYHLAWFNNASERHGLFYSRHSGSVGEMTESIQFGDYSKAASHPNVIHLKDSVWLAWKQYDGTQDSIWLQKSTDNGNSWQKAEQIASTEKSSDYPFLIKDKKHIYLQWQTEVDGFQLIRVN